MVSEQGQSGLAGEPPDTKPLAWRHLVTLHWLQVLALAREARFLERVDGFVESTPKMFSSSVPSLSQALLKIPI